MGLRVQDLRFRIQGLGFGFGGFRGSLFWLRVEGVGCRVKDLGLSVLGAGLRV